jgi:hypothetical protein
MTWNCSNVSTEELQDTYIKLSKIKNNPSEGDSYRGICCIKWKSIRDELIRRGATVPGGNNEQ